MRFDPLEEEFDDEEADEEYETPRVERMRRSLDGKPMPVASRGSAITRSRKTAREQAKSRAIGKQRRGMSARRLRRVM